MSNYIKPVLLIGDIHGAFGRLKDIVHKQGIENCYLICVGDLGIGFKRTQTGEIMACADLNDYFSKKNIHFMSVRGNHDNPDYFNKDQRIVMSNFELLPDYTVKELNGEKFLFVGGAISIDRLYRVPGQSYWHDEPFVLKPELATECDVLVTHSGPTWNGPFDKEGLAGWGERDPELWDDCYKERIAHDELIKLAKPKMHYCGHFHSYHWVEMNGCYSTILSIEQVKEHRLIESQL
jgi:predicted phosphodiesterase